MEHFFNNGVNPGYSERTNDPEILRGVKKLNRSVRLLFLAVIVLPTLLCVFLADGKYLWLGVALSAIFLLALLVREFKFAARKPWEGVITEKYTKTKRYVAKTEDIVSYSKRTKYYLKVKLNDGSECKKQVDNVIYYEYLNTGDRVRFLPKLNGYYEKYDKSRDEYLICPACWKKNDPHGDRCTHCGVPLLK